MTEHRHGAGLYVVQPNQTAGYVHRVANYLVVDSVAWTDAAGDPAVILPHFTKVTSASAFTTTARKKIARDGEQREAVENVSFDWYYLWYRGRVYYTADADLATVDTVKAANQAIRDGGRFRPLDGAPRANRFVFMPSTKFTLPGDKQDDSGIKGLGLLVAAGVGAAVVIKKAAT